MNIGSGIPDPNNLGLPAKFHDSILNNAKADDPTKYELKQTLDKIFANQTNLLSKLTEKSPAHILKGEGLEGWIIKASREDEFGRIDDQNIYRPRRAAKIQRVIEEHKFEKTFVVPEKFLYKHENKWYVIAQKLEVNDLTDKTKLTAEECKKCIALIYEGKLEDIKVDNFYRTKDNKIAIIDTEPVTRKDIKDAKKRPLLQRILLPTSMFGLIRKEAQSARLLTELAINDLPTVTFDVNGIPKSGDRQTVSEVKKEQKKYHRKAINSMILTGALPLIASVGLLVGGALTVNPLIVGLGIASTVTASANGVLKLAHITFFAVNILLERQKAGL